MAVLVEEENGKMVLSKEVERIMTSFPNVKKKDDLGTGQVNRIR